MSRSDSGSCQVLQYAKAMKASYTCVRPYRRQPSRRPKMLGLTSPPKLLFTADEVIEFSQNYVRADGSLPCPAIGP